MRAITPEAISFVTKAEGRKLVAYLDSGGRATIGVGHTKGVKLGDKITPTESDAFLSADLAEAGRRLYRRVKPEVLDALPEARWIALLSWAFNVPDESWTLYKKLNAGKFADIPGELLKFIYDNGAPVVGLVNRRNAEVALWKSVPDSSEVHTPPATPVPAATLKEAVAQPHVTDPTPNAEPVPVAKPLAGSALATKIVTTTAAVGASAAQINSIVQPHAAEVPMLAKIAAGLTCLIVLCGVIALFIHNRQAHEAKR